MQVRWTQNRLEHMTTRGCGTPMRSTPTGGFVVTVIAAHVDGESWGVTAWKTTGAERRSYQEAHHDDPH
ncbi:MAG: hypothetical protein ACR2K2_12190 [Mycobacteriales bacterium]